jgi:hypothetical protein
MFVILFWPIAKAPRFVSSRHFGRPRDLLSPYRQKGRSSNRATQFMFWVIVVNFVLFSLSVAVGITWFLSTIQKALTQTLEIPLIDREPLISRVQRPFFITQRWASTFNVSLEHRPWYTMTYDKLSSLLQLLTGDLVVIWRAWVLYEDNKWIFFLPGSLWIGALGE